MEPIKITSRQIEDIIDALSASPKREVTFQVDGKAPLTLTVECMTVGELNHTQEK